MSAITSAMSGHHARCDHLFAVAETLAAQGRWDEATSAFGVFGAEFDRHLRAEENVLFPAFESATGAVDGPTAVMRMEHERMRALLAQIGLALQAHDRQRIDDYASTLVILMQQHNVKEEGVLYPMCDRALGAGAGEMLARLELGNEAP
jgi:hemerythrin-like domain-containing protein